MEVSGLLHAPAALSPGINKGKGSLNPLDMKLCGPQSRSGFCGGERSVFPAGIRTVAFQVFAIPTELKSKIFLLYKCGVKIISQQLLAQCHVYF
jgi:hypothetical protein